MAKTIEKTKSALKLKAQPKEGALTLRLGVKKIVLPFEVRMLKSDEFLFVHLPPAAGLFQFDGKTLKEVTSDADGEKATASFRKPRKRRGSRTKKSAEMPDALAKALTQVPSGYKLGYDANGAPRLVKTRVRTKKS